MQESERSLKRIEEFEDVERKKNNYSKLLHDIESKIYALNNSYVSVKPYNRKKDKYPEEEHISNLISPEEKEVLEKVLSDLVVSFKTISDTTSWKVDLKKIEKNFDESYPASLVSLVEKRKKTVEKRRALAVSFNDTFVKSLRSAKELKNKVLRDLTEETSKWLFKGLEKQKSINGWEEPWEDNQEIKEKCELVKKFRRCLLFEVSATEYAKEFDLRKESDVLYNLQVSKIRRICTSAPGIDYVLKTTEELRRKNEKTEEEEKNTCGDDEEFEEEKHVTVGTDTATTREDSVGVGEEGGSMEPAKVGDLLSYPVQCYLIPVVFIILIILIFIPLILYILCCPNSSRNTTDHHHQHKLYSNTRNKKRRAPVRPKWKPPNLKEFLEELGMSEYFEEMDKDDNKERDLLPKILKNPDILKDYIVKKIDIQRFLEALEKKRSESFLSESKILDKISGKYDWNGKSIIIKENNAYFENKPYEFEKLEGNVLKIDIKGRIYVFIWDNVDEMLRVVRTKGRPEFIKRKSPIPDKYEVKDILLGEYEWKKYGVSLDIRKKNCYIEERPFDLERVTSNVCTVDMEDRGRFVLNWDEVDEVLGVVEVLGVRGDGFFEKIKKEVYVQKIE